MLYHTAPQAKPILPGQKALSVTQAALYAGVSPPTLRKWMRAGLLPYTTIGSTKRPPPRILICDLDRLLSAQSASDEGGK